MRHAFLLSIVLLIAPFARAEKLADTILALDQQFWEAGSKHDVKTLARLIADDYVGFTADDTKWTKSSVLEQYARVRTADLKVRGERQVLRLNEHTAVLTYEATFSIFSGDTLTDTANQRMSAVWVQRDGGWFVAFAQTAPGTAPVDPKVAEAVKNANGVAWGNANDAGIAYGINFVPHDKRTARFGEVLSIELRARNTSKQPVTLTMSHREMYLPAYSITGADGKALKVQMPFEPWGVWAIIKPTVKPGETLKLGTMRLVFQGAKAERSQSVEHPTVHGAAGKYTISYPEAGTLEVEVGGD